MRICLETQFTHTLAFAGPLERNRGRVVQVGLHCKTWFPHSNKTNSGDDDLICNSLGIEYMVDRLNWGGAIGMKV